jgi:PPOX class probable F420-dependent enzyme
MGDPLPAYGHGVNQRSQIRMTDEEIDAFLLEVHTMNCATINHDATIHLVAMWYGFLDGYPALLTKAKSQKVANLRRNPQITCLVEEGSAYEELRGVEIVGTAEIVEDAGRVLELGLSVFERHYDAARTADPKSAVDSLVRKRVAVKVVPTRYVSWDHRKLGEPPGT